MDTDEWTLCRGDRFVGTRDKLELHLYIWRQKTTEELSQNVSFMAIFS